ncbi:MAG: tetratricopeptide repeat protein [Anaerolineaceae bacterium]
MDTLTEISELSEKAKSEFQKNNFKEAVADFQTCLDLLLPLNNPLDIAEMKNNLCVALLRNSQFQEALNIVLGTDLIFSQAGEIQKQGIALANIASVYEALKEYDLAAQAYAQAIECFKQSGDKKLRSITLRSLSDLQLRSGKQLQAIASLQASYSEKPQAKFKDKFFASALGKLVQKLLGK